MKSAHRLMALFFALLVSACITKPAGVVNVTPTSANGAIMLYLEPSPVQYQLNMLRFNEEGTALEANTFSAIYPFRVEPNQAGYYSVVAKPGRYVFVSVHQQGYWAVCFHNKTVAFDVRPGEIAYVGRFNPTPHILQLQMLAQQSGRLRTNGQEVHFFDGIIPPRLAPATSADVQAAQTYAAANFPNATAPIHAPELSQAQFGIGHSAYGGGLVCGGYRERPIGSRD